MMRMPSKADYQLSLIDFKEKLVLRLEDVGNVGPIRGTLQNWSSKSH